MTIDEITAVRDCRPAVEPDARAKARAGARLHTEFHRTAEPTPRRAWWRSTRMVPVAAIAGVAAACLAVGLVAGPAGLGGDGTDRPSASASAAHRSTAQTMELAAHTVAKRSFTAPGPRDWLYAKTLSSAGDEPGENWTRFDGTYSAGYLRGKLMTSKVVNGPGENTPTQDYRFFAGLSDDPARAREQIYQASGSLEGDWGDADARAFAYVLELFEDTTTMPPDAQAKLYRALATIPGVRIDRDVTDAAGRHGLGVTRSDGRYRSTLILSDDDYRYLGQRYVGVDDVLSDIALVAAGIVDGPGDRP